MNEPDLIRKQRTVLRDLIRLAADRAKAESETESTARAALESAERKHQRRRQELTQAHQVEKESTERAYREARQKVIGRFDAEHPATESAFREARQKVLARFEAEKEAAENEHKQARWEASAIADAALDGASARFKEVERQLEHEVQWLQSIELETKTLLNDWKQHPKEPEAVPLETRPGDPMSNLKDRIAEADTQLLKLQRLDIPKLARANRIWIIYVAIAVLSIVPLWRTMGPLGIAACVVGTAFVGGLFHLLFAAIARSQVAKIYRPLRLALAEAEILSKTHRDQSTASYNRQRAEIKHRRDQDQARADEASEKKLAEIHKRRDNDLRQVEEKYPRLLNEIKQRRDRELPEIEEKYPRLLAEIKSRNENDLKKLREDHRQKVDSGKAAQENAWRTLADGWRAGMSRTFALVDQINREDRRLFPSWDEPAWEAWTPPETIPPVIRFGEFTVDRQRIPAGIPRDDRLKTDAPTQFDLPAFLPFPGKSSMLFKASDAGRDKAVQAIQAVMLRLVTSVPAGKMKFTIIDPVGLGQNFAAFMHLADHDESLINSKIWTESKDIDQRLADLTEHMEKVIQKYLRNEFQTIEEYNTHAGEVADPFRVLVIANFPANFSEAATRRLLSIAHSGARCGVYTLISVDTKQALPSGFQLKELERDAATLTWQEGRFVWKDEDFESYPLVLDTPPAADFATRLLQRVGERAKLASRVEVPFEIIVPPVDRWWTFDSSTEIDVPLGRVGANKLQYLKLGRGTSQHVLIAGRTGSGKSSLLHALITNVALHYSPEQVELYLIDFKKGVEFKTYATHELPHARVIAVESEREFGVSVLQRLDAEMKVRGDKFRDVGAQDLNSFRQADPHTPMPRMLLVVDEFQEFFVEDDKLAQETALLLDRLVRQGRAFGIHIHLGSQTLSGAFSLARSTLGQMGVRIALQCSESDAHLILSEDNGAARLLSRPGEAIYNDANGVVEGNHFFQVVWLGDERREEYLKRIHDLASRREYAIRPQIVFEGNVPADVSKNPLLVRLLSSQDWPSPPKAARAWLGEAIAIKDPTAAVFRPQSGSNLLMIGQQGESAAGIVSMVLVSLAAQYPPNRAQFHVFDGSPVDAVYAGILDRVADALPHPVQVVGGRDLPATINEVAEEVTRRQSADLADAPTVFVVVFDLQRFRDLRKAEDDYSYSSMGEDAAPNPSKQFATILREGPAVGVHTILWCDSLNNVNRALDRQSLREFEMRVLFQMSPTDSSTLIDSPAASRLGPNRALYSSEEEGQLEKFRPYAVPSDDWLALVREQLRSRQAIVSG